MAIDTAAKRRSAGAVGGVPFVPGVTPDTTKPVAWRQQSGWGYSGIEAGVPTAEVPNVGSVIIGRRSKAVIVGSLSRAVIVGKKSKAVIDGRG